MVSQLAREAVARRAVIVGACLAWVCVTQLTGAGKSPMRILKYDPAAEKMELFAAIEAGALSTRIVAHDAEGGNLFIENLSGKPLTVVLPEALAMSQVLKQVGNGFFNQPGGNGVNGNGMNGNNGLSNVMGGGQQGGAQSLGVGFGQQNNGNNNGMAVGNNVNAVPGGLMGNGFFSIPADRVAQVPFRAVCLNYGKPDPAPRMTYKPIPLETYSQDKVLQETLKIFGQGREKQWVAQAATWHLTDKLSWDHLASVKKYTIPGVFTSQVPIFSMAQLRAAQEMIAEATKRANARPSGGTPLVPKDGKIVPNLETASAVP